MAALPCGTASGLNIIEDKVEKNVGTKSRRFDCQQISLNILDTQPYRQQSVVEIMNLPTSHFDISNNFGVSCLCIRCPFKCHRHLCS